MPRSARLEGWKEIARVFGRSVRTIQRWERDEQLPVRRHVHATGATVYAFSHELAAWRAKRSSLMTLPENANEPDAAAYGFSAETLLAMSRQHWAQRTSDGLKRSIALARTVLQRNPAHAPAYGALALAYVTRSSYGYAPPSSDLELAREAALSAIQLDPAVVEAHQALGFFSIFDRNWAVARIAFEQALRLDPLNATTYQWFSVWHLAMNADDVALRFAQRAEELDPAAAILAAHAAWLLHEVGRFDDAIAKTEALLRRSPHFWRGHFNLALSLAATGRPREAAEVTEVAAALSDLAIVRMLFAYTLAQAGEVGRADGIMETMERSGVYLSPYWRAYVAAGLGRTANALACISDSAAQREWFVAFLEHEPAFAPLRPLPAFGALAQRIGLPGVA